MYVVYSICLYFLSIFLFTYNKNHLSKKYGAPPQVSFFAYCMGFPLRSVSSLTIGAPSVHFLRILYEGPLRLISSLTI